MAIVNAGNLAALNTSFHTALNDTFGDKAPPVYSQFCTEIPVDGTSFDVVVVDGEPVLRQWLGARQFKDLIAYRLNRTIVPWEASINIEVTEINGDKSGILGARVKSFVDSAKFWKDKLVVDALVANPTCYDGQALLANSHPNVTTGTSDNLTTSALSHAEVKTGWDALRQMTTGDGEPLDIAPTALIVGTSNERLGMEITGSDRPVPISTAGVQDATSAVQSSVTVKNYIGGRLTLIVTPRITGEQWFLADLSKPGRRPMILGVQKNPEGIILDKPDDSCVVYRNQVDVCLSAYAQTAAGDWHTIYGSVTA